MIYVQQQKTRECNTLIKVIKCENVRIFNGVRWGNSDSHVTIKSKPLDLLFTHRRLSRIITVPSNKLVLSTCKEYNINAEVRGIRL